MDKLERIFVLSPSSNPRRPGVTIFECVASLVMLSVLFGLIAQMVVQVDRAAVLQQQSRLASVTLENLMERAAARGWEHIERASLDEDLGGRLEGLGLADAELTTEVVPGERQETEKRITLTLAWTPTPGAEPRRLALTTFLYAQREDAE